MYRREKNYSPDHDTNAECTPSAAGLSAKQRGKRKATSNPDSGNANTGPVEKKVNAEEKSK
jgi:hypothetical protein